MPSCGLHGKTTCFPATASAEGRAQRVAAFSASPATASAEGPQLNAAPSARHQLNGAPFPATASAEGGQFNGPPSPTPNGVLRTAAAHGYCVGLISPASMAGQLAVRSTSLLNPRQISRVRATP